MLACPNVSNKQWKELVKTIGEKEAFREYMKLNTGAIPSVIDIVPLNQLPMSKVEDSENMKTLTEDVAKDMMDFLAKKFPGLKGNVINDKSKKWKGTLAEGKTPTINLAYAEVSDGFHEFSHPFLMALRKSNPETFKSLYSSLKETSEWEEISKRATARVDRLYPELKGDANLDLYKEEVLATAIGYAAELNLATSRTKISNNLARVINNIFKWINSFFTEFFADRVKTNEISPNTTFGEIIDMFVDTRSQILLDANWDKATDNLRIADAMTGAITTNQEILTNQLANDISAEMQLDKSFDLDEYINNWLDKTFKIPKKDYKPRKEKPNQIALSVANSMIDIAMQKGYQLRGMDIKERKSIAEKAKVKDETIEKLAEVLTPITLNYKFSNYLTNKKNVSIALNQPMVTIKQKEKVDEDGKTYTENTPSLPISMAEAEAVLDFQDYIQNKYPDRKSMLSDDINKEYIDWATENYGINWTEATGHVGYGMNNISNSPYDHYTRVLFVDDYINYNNHQFKIQNSGVTGNGLGWYASVIIEGDRFDHEFQSDILPEISKSYNEGEYFAIDGSKLVEQKKSDKVRQLAEAKLYKMLEASADFLIPRYNWLREQIITEDKDYLTSRGTEIFDVSDDELTTNIDDIELPFSKLDSYDPEQIDNVVKYLTSEIEVQIQAIKEKASRNYSGVEFTKGYTKMYNLFLSRKNDDQKELFDWIKTFEIREIKDDTNIDLPFSKTEETDISTNWLMRLDRNTGVYLTTASLEKFPKTLKKIYDIQVEWASSNAPLKPNIPNDLNYFIRSLASEAASTFLDKKGEIKKNYGKTKSNIQRKRDLNRQSLEKTFKSYNFNKTRLKALEWRRNIYSRPDAIIKIAEFYKGQYNRFYKFYSDVYDSALPIAKEKTGERAQDKSLARYKKYNDLYYKWFDIIIPQSMNSAKAEGRNYYYLPTAMAMNTIEGNNIAEKVYWTPFDSLETAKQSEDSLKRSVTAFISQNTPESTDVVRSFLSSDIRSGYTQQTTAEEIAEDLISSTLFTESGEFNKFLSTQSNLPTKPNGPLYTALVKYARKNNIKLTFEKPSWATKHLIKADLTGYTVKPIDRFSKLDVSAADNPMAKETPEEQKAKYNNTVVKAIADSLSISLGVEYNIVTPEEARELTDKTNMPWNGEPAFFYGGKVYFVDGNMNTERVFHEFSHPLIEAVSNLNPKLFDNLYNAILQTPEAELLTSLVAQNYPNLEAGSIGFKKEVLVRALTHEAMVPSKSKGFREFITKLMFAIKQALRSVFGTPVKVEKLTANTTLAELAKMLKSDNFDISPEAIQNNDVQYARDISEFAKAVEDVESSAISDIIRNYYRVINSQISRIKKNRNYSDAKELLIDDETQSGILQGIKLTLENSAEIDKRLESLLTEMDIREKNVNSLIHSILKMDALTQKIAEKINQLKKNIDNKDNLTNIIYYDYLLKNWSAFIDDANVKLFDAGVNPMSKFGQSLTGLKGRIDTTRRQILTSYGPGVVTVLKESLEPLIQGIDDYYGKRIKNLEDKGGNPKLIEDLKAEYENTRLTDQRILDLLTNKAGDTNMFSYFAEAYTNSPDPVVGGFAIYVKNAYNKADAIIQRNMNDFTREIEPLLEKAGYNRANFTALMSQLVFRDTVTFYNQKTEKLESKEVVTFLNPFKNVDSALAKYKHELEKAKEEGNKELADGIVKEQRKHLRDYFNQEYQKDYYERESLYDNIKADESLEKLTYQILGLDMQTASADQKSAVSDFYNEVAMEAYREKYLLLNAIKELEGHNYFDDTTFEDSVEQTQLLWRDYTRMASLTDAKGSPKTGKELLKAQIERKFRKANNKFNEWVPITGMGNKPSFEFAIRNYEQSLVDSGIPEGSEEFIEKKQRWIDKNTTIAYTKEYYDERNDILAKLKAVYATLPKAQKDSIDSTAEMEEMLDMATGFRDEDGQIVGSDMSSKTKEKIRILQQAVADKRTNMAGFSGLTKAEMEELGSLYDIIISKQKLSPEQRYRLQELQDTQVLNGVPKAVRAEINLLYKKLAEIQSKEATDYYVNTVNEFLNEMGEPLIDNVTANQLGDPSMYVRLFNKNPEFAKWFKENHIMKEVYDKEEDTMINVYDRLFVWNRTRPNNPDHYVKTTLSNGEVIQGKPILSYFYRRVKDDYRTEKKVGKTVDNKGNWLPLTMSQGAKDALYQNENYDRLRRDNAAAFDVLEKMKEYHLKFQEGNPNTKKLYMQVPRYGTMAIENVVKLGSRENLKRVLSNIRQVFFKRSDDYEDGFNFEPAKLAYLDMIEGDIANVPVTGLYDLKPEEISMNLLDSMMKHMASSTRQQELIDINPYVQAIKEVANFNKNEKGEETTRAKALKNLYDREFKGKQLKGFLSQNNPFARVIQKGTGQTAKITSLGFFALDIPSAIKNMYAAKVEQFIEASGGRFLGPLSLIQGKRIAWKVMAVDGMMGTEYYRTKNRSLHMQMLQVFDPGQDYFKKAQSTSFGRSFTSDLVTGSWLMSPRKFLQYEATLEAFFGMMYHVKVTQTLNGNSNEISYIDAWEIKDGQIELKEGIDKEWAPGGKKFNQFKNASHELTNRMEGTYSEFDQPEMNRYFLLRQMLFMKKFFMSMAANHVAVNRPSAALGTMSAGNYANLIRVIRNMIPQFSIMGRSFGKYGPGYIKDMSQEEVSAVRKVAAQTLSLAAMYATMYLVFDFDDDDELEENLAKMKKRSGDLLSKNFKLEGWLVNNAEVTFYKTMTEVQTWSHPIISTKTVAEMAYQSALWDRGIKAPVMILYNTYGNLTGNQKSFYSKDSGPYPWQKKGGSKAVTDAAKIFGFTGSTLDPVRSMKNHETLARSLNFR